MDEAEARKRKVYGVEPGESDKPLGRAQREACWGARDKYLACLEAHAEEAIYKDSGKKNAFRSPAACADPLLAMHEAGCPASWVLHFQVQWGNERLLRQLREREPPVQE